MVLPVVAYGHPVLKKKAAEVEPLHPNLKGFIDDLFETMYQSDGVGLAAPQVNQSIRIFVVDSSVFAEKHPETENFKKVFINPNLYNEEGDEWSFNEGCLSFPGLREDITRKPVIYILTASSPSPASPTTTNSLYDSNNFIRPLRTIG